MINTKEMNEKLAKFLDEIQEYVPLYMTMAKAVEMLKNHEQIAFTDVVTIVGRKVVVTFSSDTDTSKELEEMEAKTNGN